MVVENFVVGLVVSLVVRTFYSVDSKPCLLTKLAVESCEVIADASIDVHAQRKLLLVMDLQVVRQDATGCSDSSLLDDLSLAIVVDVKMHRLQMDEPAATFD